MDKLNSLLGTGIVRGLQIRYEHCGKNVVEGQHDGNYEREIEGNKK